MKLSVDHNVYVLGAGFSKDANMPLVAEFLNRMRDSQQWLVNQGRGRKQKSVEEVLKFRLEAASRGVLDSARFGEY